MASLQCRKIKHCNTQETRGPPQALKSLGILTGVAGTMGAMSAGMKKQREPSALDHTHDQHSFALYAAARIVVQSYRPYLDELGVTYPQFMVVHALYRNGSQTVSQIADQLFLDAGTVTPVLKRLQARGWVARTRCMHDERKVVNTLTHEGLQLAQESVGVSASALNRGKMEETLVRPLVAHAELLLDHLAA